MTCSGASPDARSSPDGAEQHERSEQQKPRGARPEQQRHGELARWHEGDDLLGSLAGFAVEPGGTREHDAAELACLVERQVAELDPAIGSASGLEVHGRHREDPRGEGLHDID